MSHDTIKKLAGHAKEACEALSLLSTQTKNRALQAMATALIRNQRGILKANARDLALAKTAQMAGSLLGRLALDEGKIKKIAGSLTAISKLPDPVGKVLSITRRPNGLLIKKVRVPIGVVLIIYESRPGVTADCMALCLKSGNSVILKGGREAFYSDLAIYRTLKDAAMGCGVPSGAFEFVPTSERSAFRTLLRLSDQINLVIPRGGEGLIREVARISKIPVIKHSKGVCHVFVDRSANLKKAEGIVLNAKVQNPGVCNAMETLLVHRQVAGRFLPRMCRELADRHVEIRGCEATRRIVPGLAQASEADWYAEYLDLILSVRVVKDLREAIRHIQKYGSHHSDAIVTEDRRAARLFTEGVDSACVFVNCSTRFNDGGEFGKGAEMGISTEKLHARGPMGLEELTSYKYIVLGTGQTRR